tara:strand:- start:416 stop:1210 length:795 start_codon:yes stop_codon:yes gene_type:complete
MIALCFFVSTNKLHQESIWEQQIEKCKNKINIYIHWKPGSLTNPSKFIRKYALPQYALSTTSYFNMVPAYLSTLSYAMTADYRNQYFFLLTESCVPVKSFDIILNTLNKLPKYSSIMRWSHANWNVEMHRRANLRLLPEKYHLRNDPWFMLSRAHVLHVFEFRAKLYETYRLICQGDIANESFFAIALCTSPTIAKNIINETCNAADWSRMSSATSPYVFHSPLSQNDKRFIEVCKHDPYVFFIRKVNNENTLQEELTRLLFNN